jgi:hypothetical protein
MSLKNLYDVIGNRTHDLPGCSAVPQPTAPTRAPKYCYNYYNIKRSGKIKKKFVVPVVACVPSVLFRCLYETWGEGGLVSKYAGFKGNKIDCKKK